MIGGYIYIFGENNFGFGNKIWLFVWASLQIFWFSHKLWDGEGDQSHLLGFVGFCFIVLFFQPFCFVLMKPISTPFDHVSIF
jgi:hypothetical protein